MQGYQEFKIVYIPRLNNDIVCPVKAFQNMTRTLHLKPIDLLFLIEVVIEFLQHIKFVV